jgi:hypothetical protein
MTSTIKAKESFNIWQFFVRLQNPLMKWLLQSPLHGLVSSWYLLIHVCGRKSGQIYTTPVQYKQVGNTLTIISNKDYQWWRNLKGGAALQVCLRGQGLNAWGDVSEQLSDVEAAYKLLYPQMEGEFRNKLMPRSLVIHVELR